MKKKKYLRTSDVTAQDSYYVLTFADRSSFWKTILRKKKVRTSCVEILLTFMFVFVEQASSGDTSSSKQLISLLRRCISVLAASLASVVQID